MSEKLKNGINILVGQTALVCDQTNILIKIHYRPTKILCYFEFLRQFANLSRPTQNFRLKLTIPM